MIATHFINVNPILNIWADLKPKLFSFSILVYWSVKAFVELRCGQVNWSFAASWCPHQMWQPTVPHMAARKGWELRGCSYWRTKPESRVKYFDQVWKRSVTDPRPIFWAATSSFHTQTIVSNSQSDQPQVQSARVWKHTYTLFSWKSWLCYICVFDLFWWLVFLHG